MTSGALARTVARLEPDLVRLRRDLHRNPELAFGERRTASIVGERLEALGLGVRSGVGGTGVVADLVGTAPGPRVLVRADMDALPITEQTGLDYSSTTSGAMHACGHDAHVSALLGTVTVLAEVRELPGSIRSCFQPGEEVLTGARRMIADGVMDDVDAVLGAHLLSPIPFGTISMAHGPFLAGGDLFEVLGGAPVTSNVPEYAALVAEAVIESGRATLIDGGPITATDDVACLLDMAPGAFFLVGTGGPRAVPHHHPAFQIDERATALMSEILARAAIKVLHHEAGDSV